MFCRIGQVGLLSAVALVGCATDPTAKYQGDGVPIEDAFVSAAAHGAGFADSAHFARTSRQTFGFPPSLLQLGQTPEPTSNPSSDQGPMSPALASPGTFLS